MDDRLTGHRHPGLAFRRGERSDPGHVLAKPEEAGSQTGGHADDKTPRDGRRGSGDGSPDPARAERFALFQHEAGSVSRPAQFHLAGVGMADGERRCDRLGWRNETRQEQDDTEPGVERGRCPDRPTFGMRLSGGGGRHLRALRCENRGGPRREPGTRVHEWMSTRARPKHKPTSSEPRSWGPRRLAILRRPRKPAPWGSTSLLSSNPP